MRPFLALIILTLTALFGFMGWSAYEASKTFESEALAREQAERTTAILGDIQTIRRYAIEAETGQRGFLLSQDERYLEPFYRGLSNYKSTFASLKSQIRDRETELQLELIPQIESLMAKKFTEMEKTVDLAKTGSVSAAIAVTRTNRGQDLMTETMGYIQDLEDEERRILSTRLAAAEQREERAGKYLTGIGLGIIGLLIATILLVSRGAKLAQAETHLAELEAANDRTKLVAQELNHRVKNLFAIVLSIIRNTGRVESDPKAVATKIQDRVFALSKAHELTIKSEETDTADFADLARAIINPHTSTLHSYNLSGDAIELPVKVITPIGLIIHELATNAVKYGAWSTADKGHIDIRHERQTDGDADRMLLTWTETGGPDTAVPPTDKKGFGSRMIDMSARQLGGDINTEFRPEGIVIRASFCV